MIQSRESWFKAYSRESGMEKFIEDLQIVVLESPCDTWNHPLVPDLFRDMIGLKLKGYSCEYPYGVLAVDGSDLISIHFLLCRKEAASGRLRPVMGIRWTSHMKCRTHYMNFPGLALIEQAGAKEYVEALKEVIRSVDSRGAQIFYLGSLTIDPDERKDKERSLLYREILTAMSVNYKRENADSELMAGGTIRFKFDRYLRSLGFQPFLWKGRELGPIRVHHLAGEAVLVLHLKEFSFEARQMAAKWDELWKRRIWITPQTIADLSAKPVKRAG